MKATGIYWLPETPADWEIAGAGLLFAESKKLAEHDAPVLTPSKEFGVITRDEYSELSGHRPNQNFATVDQMLAVEPGHFIITMGSFESGLEYSRISGKITSHYRVLEASDRCDHGYYRWLFKSAPFIDGLSGLATEIRKGQEINYTKFSRLSLPLPPLGTQRRIAEYLDRETGQIDETITRIDTVIDLLRERSRALISNRLFPPGSSTQKLGRFIESLPGYAFPSEQFQSGASGPRLLRGINVKTTGVDWEDQVNLIPEAESPPEYELDAGDIVFGMDRPIVGGGTRVTEITQEDEGALLVQRVLRIRPTDHSNSRYLFYLLKSDEFANYLSVLFTGISVPHVSESQVHNFRTFFPSADEQSDIAKELDDEAEKIDLMINRASLVKNLLGERRSALITAAVTGKVEV